MGQCVFERFADDVAGLVHIAQAMGLIHHHQIPFHTAQIVGLGLGKLVRANKHAGLVERATVPLLALFLVAFGLQDQRL